MRIAWAGSFSESFGRNRKLLRLLRLGGHEVTTIPLDLWHGERRLIAERGKLAVLKRATLGIPRFVIAMLRAERPDAYLVSYPGWFDLPVVKLCALIRRTPVVFDPFISLHDTMIGDRQMYSRRHPMALLARIADWVSLGLADRVLADTPEDARFFARISKSNPKKYGVVALGADEELFRPLEVPVEDGLVIFHGTFVPLQGLPMVVQAAHALRERGVRFRLFGDGQERKDVERLVASLPCPNVQLHGLVPIELLPREIARASICLGIFGRSEKAKRVVPHKLFEALAVGRPVITADTPAVRTAFTTEEVVTVAEGDVEGLAAAIEALLDDPERREAIARRGREAFLERFSDQGLTKALNSLLTAPLV